MLLIFDVVGSGIASCLLIADNVSQLASVMFGACLGGDSGFGTRSSAGRRARREV